MSGRQQHYLPQFLQRQFAVDFQNNGRMCVKVFRYGKFDPLITSTGSIGKERDFYGDSRVSPADEKITKMELDLVNIISVASSENGAPSQDEMAKLVSILSIRTKSVRNALSNLAPKFLEVARDASKSDRFILAELNKQTQYKALKRLVVKEHPEVNNCERNMLAKLIQIERMKLIHKRNDTVALFKAAIDNVMDKLLIDASTIADSAYLKIFENDASSLNRINSFRRFKYKVARITNGNQFILGDCAVIAKDGLGRARLAVSDINDESKIEHLYFPISPDTCIYGCLNDFQTEIDVNQINNMASSLSLAFFISPIRNDDINLSLSKLIGSEIEPIIAIQELHEFANEFN